MDSWMGYSRHDLVMKWGPPARTSSDGAGGDIYIYATSAANPYGGGILYRYRMFFIGKDDRIYHWISQGGSVPPQQLDVNMYIH